MKVNIVGAGISGLTLGCYLQMCGFETEIFEKHSKSGGLCTSWKRGEYTFDGCIQWLMGSDSGNSFHKLWSELIDMNSIKFVNHEIRYHIELKNTLDKYGSPIFILYTNLNRLEDYLIDIAVEDKKQIKKFISFARNLQKHEFPPVIEQAVSMLTMKEKMNMIKHIPLLLQMLKWRNVTNVSFAKKLKNPFLKEAFNMLFDGEELCLLLITVPLSSYDCKSAGYPIGGSYKFAQKFEERYFQLGGKIKFNTTISKVITENDKAIGLQYNDTSNSFSDITISAADWNFSLFDALEGKYTNPLILLLRDNKKLDIYYSVFMVSLGLSRTFDNYPNYSRFPLKEKLISPDGTVSLSLEVHIYNYDSSLAPVGKTAVSVSFYTTKGDYWINLRDSDKTEYDSMKNNFANNIIDALDDKFGDIKQHIEEIDITTPATYNRYTGNYGGSVQGWLPGKNILASSPIKADLPGLKNFYFTGHWTHPGGGLPIAIKSGRDIAQIICKKYKVPFVSK